MRAYHLLSERWALESLAQGRLKLSLLEDMNDPFELLAVELNSPEQRRFFRRLREAMHKTVGVLCFSRSWSNPVLWSHYADRHRGICLGFDIPDQWAKPVTYTGTRLPSDIERQAAATKDIEPGLALITTKFEHWRYEDEVRLIFALKHAYAEDPLFFIHYCEALQLKEVITGPRSTVTMSMVRQALGTRNKGVKITRARLAFRSFEVVPNRRRPLPKDEA